jgi:hypothetical protein
MAIKRDGAGGPPYGNDWGFNAHHDDTWIEQ